MKNVLTLLIILSISLLFFFHFITPVSALTSYFKDNFPSGLVGESLLSIDSADYSSNAGYYYTNPNFIYDGINGLWSDGNTSAGDILKSTSINQSYYCAGMTLQRDINDSRTYPAITINGTNQNDGYIFNTDLNWTTGIIQESSIYTPSKGFLYKTTTLHFNASINQHWIQACNNSGNLAIYFDGIQLAEVVDNSFSGGNVNFSLFYAPHSHILNWAITDNPTINYQDSIGITNFTLPVPLLKQTDPLWGTQTYDSANKWSSLHPTIDRWGCALTSATMVMQYYGLKHMPDGTPLDPASVNSWLKNQPNGYVNGGSINWITLTRLTKEAKDSGQNPDFAYDALEFRYSPFSTSVLENDLQNNQPDILGEKAEGHFIVAKGENNGIFAINDPYYTYDSLSSYNNTASSIKRYIPSHTNLSYIEIVLPTTLDAVLQNSTGQKMGSDGINNFNDIPDAAYYTENGITDPISGETTPDTKFLLVPKPQDGNYTLTLYSTTNQTFNIKVLKYDSDANEVADTLTGVIHPNNSKSFPFSYQQQPTVRKSSRLCQIFQQHIPNQQISDFLCSLVDAKIH